VVDLVTKTPLQGLLPLQIGAHKAVEPVLGAMSSIMPYQGKHLAVSKALQDGCGLELPGLGQSASSGAAHVLWFGRGQFLLIGAEPPTGLGDMAALSDQSDAWAVADLSGPQVEAILARLSPVDLRLSACPIGASARTLIGHMNGAVIRLSQTSFRLMVFRSMAKTLTHDLSEAMQTLASREPA
jgi:heterotetrameric sarcosine oxidase gamma subunit